MKRLPYFLLALLFIGGAAYLFPQKAIRTTPLAIGQKQDIEIVTVNLNYQFNKDTGQFHFQNAIYVWQEGEIVGGEWVQRDQGTKEIPVETASLPLQNAAAAVKERVLRNYLQAMRLSDKEAPIEAAKTTTSSTTTTTETTTTTTP